MPYQLGPRFFRVLLMLSTLGPTGGCGRLSTAQEQAATIAKFPADFVDPTYCEDVVFAPNGRVASLLKPEGEVKFCDLTTGKVETLPCPYKGELWGSTAAYSKDGKILAVVYDPHGTVIWDIAAKKEKARIPLKRLSMKRLIFMDDDRILLALVRTHEFDLVVERWEVRSGELRGTLNLGKAPIPQVLSPDGRHAILRTPDDGYGVFSLESGMECFGLKPGGDWVFSRDGSKLISCEDSQLSIRDVPSGKVLKRLPVSIEFGSDYSQNPSMSFDGKLLAVGGYPGSHLASVLSLETGKLLGRVEFGPPLSLCKFVRLSPDGRTMATQTYGVNSHDEPVTPIMKLWKLPASW